MQKSFLFALGAFIIAAFMFILSDEDVQTKEAITTFEVSDNGITVNNQLTGESFVIENNVITEADKYLANIAPAAGSDEVGSIDTNIINDVEAILSIENDVIEITK